MSSFSSLVVAAEVPQTLEPLTGILGPLETYIQTAFKVLNLEFSTTKDVLLPPGDLAPLPNSNSHHCPQMVLKLQPSN